MMGRRSKGETVLQGQFPRSAVSTRARGKQGKAKLERRESKRELLVRGECIE